MSPFQGEDLCLELRLSLEDLLANGLPLLILPSILSGSTSDFSSSPLIKGMILSMTSRADGPGYPAPDKDCKVVRIILRTLYPARRSTYTGVI